MSENLRCRRWASAVLIMAVMPGCASGAATGAAAGCFSGAAAGLGWGGIAAAEERPSDPGAYFLGGFVIGASVGCIGGAVAGHIAYDDGVRAGRNVERADQERTEQADRLRKLEDQWRTRREVRE